MNDQEPEGEPLDLDNLTFPDTPEFTLAGLREIRIPEGDPRSSLSAFIFIKGGKRYQKIASLEDLTEKERAAALAFILHHGRTIIKRMNRPPSLDTLPEFEPIPDPTEPEQPEPTPDGEKGTRKP